MTGSTHPGMRYLGIRYTAGLAFAHLLTMAEVVAVVVLFSSQTPGGMNVLLRPHNLVVTETLIVLSTISVVVGGAANIGPALRWFVAGRTPDARQRRAAINVLRRQAALLFVTWMLSGAIALAVLRADTRIWLLVGLLVVFGGIAAVNAGMLFTQRTFRPVVVAAWPESGLRATAPGVLARLITIWFLASALPSAAVVMLIVFRRNGWVIERTVPVETAVLVLALAAIVLGLQGMILVARSVSDPIRDVVAAMAHIQHGQLDTRVAVYEQSEIGRLQSGFNHMVDGLHERDRLRDLFGRHVGPDVVRRAVEGDQELSGDVRDVAILFIDLVGSTTLAATRPPEEVAGVLNDFFRIVVAAVDERNGLINKFQGDAALAVFGAPIAADGAASAALQTARTLPSQLRRLPLVDFGIGVSAGPVFAGNIGSENRYEYTVIGDAVNEAARLADNAKTTPGRVLCSETALRRADAGERGLWASHGSAVLRGRSQVSRMSAPVAYLPGAATGIGAARGRR